MSQKVNFQHSGLFTVLPQAEFNSVLRELTEGGTSKGIVGIVFPNAESMFQWFAGFSEKSLAKLGVFDFLNKAKGPGSILGTGNIPPPIGLPKIPGVNKGGREQ